MASCAQLFLRAIKETASSSSDKKNLVKYYDVFHSNQLEITPCVFIIEVVKNLVNSRPVVDRDILEIFLFFILIVILCYTFHFQQMCTFCYILSTPSVIGLLERRISANLCQDQKTNEEIF